MIRIVFRKTGYLRYISHLDLQRTMQRALTRAQIPLWYTEGFNPHPYLCFASPLPVGVNSVTEMFDIKPDAENRMAVEEIKERLKYLRQKIRTNNCTSKIENLHKEATRVLKTEGDKYEL